MFKKNFNQFYKAVKKTIKISKAELHEPHFDNLEKKALIRVIESTYVSSTGKKINEFSNSLKKIIKCKYVIPVINGTSALDIILKVLRVDSRHEILLPTLSFVATGNVILYQNATPHFVDSESRSLGVDPEKLKIYLSKICKITKKGCLNLKTKKIIKCLIITHVFGHSAKINEIKKVCKLFKLILIEDAAEGLGTFYDGVHVGNFGLLSAVSFNGNKIITTGGGGAILTNNKRLFKLAKHISSTAKIKHAYEYIHDQPGYNYRMPNLNAALGCAQLKKLSAFLKKKRVLFKKYKKNLEKISFLTLISETKNTKSNYWLQTVILKQNNLKFRNYIIKNFLKKGYRVRPVWKLLHKLKHFKKFPKMNLSTSINLEKNIINLPSSPKLIK